MSLDLISLPYKLPNYRCRTLGSGVGGNGTDQLGTYLESVDRNLCQSAVRCRCTGGPVLNGTSTLVSNNLIASKHNDGCRPLLQP